MKNIKAGGPAFPVVGNEGEKSLDGMLLRDYFAAKAMNGLLRSDTAVDIIAEHAYEIADAMLEARK